MEPTRRSARQPHLASMRAIYAEELPGLSPGLTSWTSRRTQSWGATPGCSARLARARPKGARDTARVPVLGVEAHPGAGAQPRGVPLNAQLAARDHEMMPLRPSPPSGSSSQHQGTPSHWAKHLGAQPVVLSASRGCSGHSQGAGAAWASPRTPRSTLGAGGVPLDAQLIGRVLPMLSSPRSDATRGRPMHSPSARARPRGAPSRRRSAPGACHSTLSSPVRPPRASMVRCCRGSAPDV